MNQTIVIAADHAAYKLKQYLVTVLTAQGHTVIDLGTNTEESVNYPDYAQSLARYVLEHNCKGILICGTGIGMSIAANRFKGIRAALCHSVDYAKLSREHNDANVLVLGARFTTETEALNITNTWLSTEFLAGRHAERLKLIDANNVKIIG